MAKKKVGKVKKNKKVEKSGFSELKILSFALAGAILTSFFVAIIVLSGLWGHFPFWNMIIADAYSSFGHSLAWPNVLLGIIYSFIDALIMFGLFALIYNKLIKK